MRSKNFLINLSKKSQLRDNSQSGTIRAQTIFKISNHYKMFILHLSRRSRITCADSFLLDLDLATFLSA